MTSPHSGELLEHGRALLDPLLLSRGYSYTAIQLGAGSGGPFAVGSYARDDRIIELHVRWALGIVLYRLGEAAVDHRDYVAFLGGGASYPGFSDDPMESFRHLAADLAGVCAGFVTGTNDDSFQLCAQQLLAHPDAFSQRGLPR